MAKIIAVANQKGGVGKTTTVHNLGAGLSRAGKRVLLVDLDAQANLTDAVGINPFELEKTVYDLMLGQFDFKDVLLTVDRLDLIPANLKLAEADITFINQFGRETLLMSALNQAQKQYDFILLDCPPNLGLITVNAFVTAQEIIIPVQAEYFAINGLELIQNTYNLVKQKLNPELTTGGILLTMFDKRKTLCRDVKKQLIDIFDDIVFKTTIRENVSLAEAPSHGMNIFDYKPNSYGAEDYQSLCGEILSREGV